MASITERTAYLRGLADGLNLDKEKAENKLLLEMLNVLDELAQHITETDADLDELSEYVEDMDADLQDGRSPTEKKESGEREVFYRIL